MKKTLRLLLWEECNRSCEGCCNKDYDLKNLPVCESFEGYKQIILTGGEPMLYPEKIKSIVTKIKLQNPDAKIIIYTALVNINLTQLLPIIDGVTITFHEQKDVDVFIKHYSKLVYYSRYKSIRLNIFEGIKFPIFWNSDFDIKDNMVWIKNCPVPENEVLMRL